MRDFRSASHHFLGLVFRVAPGVFNLGIYVLTSTNNFHPPFPSPSTIVSGSYSSPRALTLTYAAHSSRYPLSFPCLRILNTLEAEDIATMISSSFAYEFYDHY